MLVMQLGVSYNTQHKPAKPFIQTLVGLVAALHNHKKYKEGRYQHYVH